MYLVKANETHNTKLRDIVECRPILRNTTTVRYDILMSKERFGSDYDNAKVGHIEVSVTEFDGDHFSGNLEKFVIEATKLYDTIVLNNPKVLNGYEKL